MSWWGKALGGAFGFMLGGPLGALIGGALGHQFDKGVAGVRQLPPPGARPGGGAADAYTATFEGPERAQTAFFTAAFSVMGHIAKADGRVTPDEIRLASTAMDQLDLNEDLRRTARNLFNAGKAADFPLDDVLDQFRLEVRRSSHLIRVFLELQTHTALADGKLDRAERAILEHAARRLGVSTAALDEIERMIEAEYRYRSSSGAGGGLTESDAYDILGIDRDASDADVKRAYRRLMNQHHPDKLVSKGLPEEMLKLATEKTQEIKLAYETIKAARKS